MKTRASGSPEVKGKYTVDPGSARAPVPFAARRPVSADFAAQRALALVTWDIAGHAPEVSTHGAVRNIARLEMPGLMAGTGDTSDISVSWVSVIFDQTEATNL